MRSIGNAGDDHMEELASLEVEEIQMGTVNSKVVKCRSKPESTWRQMRNKRSCSTFE